MSLNKLPKGTKVTRQLQDNQFQLKQERVLIFLYAIVLLLPLTVFIFGLIAAILWGTSFGIISVIAFIAGLFLYVFFFVFGFALDFIERVRHTWKLQSAIK